MKTLALAVALSTAAALHVRTTQSTCSAWPQAPSLECRDALARFFAPTIIQNTEHPRRDFITKFDFDGDWDPRNQRRHVDDMQYSLPAYVYHAVVTGKQHYFVGYGFYHPIDYKRAGHENDFEGIMLIVQRQSNGEWGDLLAMETLAHDNLYQYRNDVRVKKREQDIEGNVSIKLEVDANKQLIGIRPEVIVEAKGHGVYASGYDLEPARTWVRYWPGDSAEEPESVSDDNVRYQLLDVLSTPLWSGRLDAKLYRDRYSQWTGTTRQNTTAKQFLGRLRGQTTGPLGARPPWAWNDKDDGVIQRGDWFIIPAFSFAHHLVIPDLVDADLPLKNYYDWNGFFDSTTGTNPRFLPGVPQGAAQVPDIIPRSGERVHPIAPDIQSLVPKGNAVEAGKDERGRWVRLRGLGADRAGGTVATLVASDLKIPLGVQNYIFIKYNNPHGVPAARLKLGWGPESAAPAESASRLVLLPSLTAGDRTLESADRFDQVKTLVLELPESPRQYLRFLDIEFTGEMPEYSGQRQSLLPQRVRDQQQLFLKTPIAERSIEVLSLAVITKTPGRSDAVAALLFPALSIIASQ